VPPSLQVGENACTDARVRGGKAPPTVRAYTEEMTSGPSPEMPNGRCRIVLTGGPGGGKTTAADLFRREIGERVVVVPESATVLYAGGFPRPTDNLARRATQRAIFHVQRNLEEIFEITEPDVPHVLDRGSLDGAAYWPGGLERFLGAMGTTRDA